MENGIFWSEIGFGELGGTPLPRIKNCEVYPERLIQAWPTAWDLHVKPKKKRIDSGIYSATSTVMEVGTWLFNIEGMFAVWV